MKISSFIPMTNPEKRGDTYLEAIQSHLLFSDELIVVDGGSTDGSVEKIRALNDPRIKIITVAWPQKDWSWTEFPRHWNAGLEACTGDWVAAGETDHIFHEKDVARLKEEISLSEKLGRAVVTVDKMQSAGHLNWYSKAKMYYFINKKMYPAVKYGFDPEFKTDLCQPINATGVYEFEEYGKKASIPTGKAIVEQDATTNALVGGTGVTLYNYLWTFKTYEMVVAERLASSNAWNKFPGFTEIHKNKWRQDEQSVRGWIKDQMRAVRSKAIQVIKLEDQPKVMQDAIVKRLKSTMFGSDDFSI